MSQMALFALAVSVPFFTAIALPNRRSVNRYAKVLAAAGLIWLICVALWAATSTPLGIETFLAAVMTLQLIFSGFAGVLLKRLATKRAARGALGLVCQPRGGAAILTV